MRLSQLSRFLFLPFALAFLVAPAFAADPVEEPQTQWSKHVAPTPESDYGNPERRRADEERRKGVLDQLCRNLKLRKDLSIGGDSLHATVGFNRRLQADLDGRLALIDEDKLDLSWSPSEGAGYETPGLGGSVWAGFQVAGKSLVVRRLGTVKTCDEVDRLVKLRDVKLVLPPKLLFDNDRVQILAERIKAMELKESWRVPMTLHVGYGVSLAEVIDAAPLATLSFGLSQYKEGQTSLRLYRRSEKEAVFRFYVDYVAVRSRSLGISKTLPVVDFAADGNLLQNLLGRQMARELNRYAAAYIGTDWPKSKGKRLALEYVADPTNPAQAEALAQAMLGNFRNLLRLARRMATSETTPEEVFEDRMQDNALLLGSPAYAALSEYGNRTRAFRAQLPFLFKRTVTSLFGQDKVTQYTGEGGKFLFFPAARTDNVEYGDTPFFGPLIKDLDDSNVAFVPHAPKDKPYDEPFAMYTRTRGLLRMRASAVEATVENANSILRLAGAARRGSVDPTMEIPAKRFVPISVPPPDGPEPSDYKGWLSLTMGMNKKAVRDALSASTAEVLKAFPAAVPSEDRAMAEWLVANGRLKGDRLDYDLEKARVELGFPKDGGDGYETWLAKMSKEAGGLVRDLAEASSASTPEERAALLSRAFSYKSRSGMSHDAVLRVLVQFVDPLDVRGYFIAAVEGKKGITVTAAYDLVAGRAVNPSTCVAGRARRRFLGTALLDEGEDESCRATP